MAVDRAILGVRQPPATVTVERGRVQSFAMSIGETDPLYLDVDAARAAGHPDVLVPPTFLFGLELEGSDTFDVLEAHGVPLTTLLHGEQSFSFVHPVHAGDVVTFTSRFTDAYSKAGGALDFVLRETEVVRADGQQLMTLRSTSIARSARGVS